MVRWAPEPAVSCVMLDSSWLQQTQQATCPECNLFLNSAHTDGVCVQALGHHQVAMCVQVMSLRTPGLVLFEAAVQVMGSSMSLGPKQPLPGGPSAIPETFNLPRCVKSPCTRPILGQRLIVLTAHMHWHGSRAACRCTALQPAATPVSLSVRVCRALVNKADAAVAHLVAEKTYKRPQLWEVPENADRLQGISKTDRWDGRQQLQLQPNRCW